MSEPENLIHLKANTSRAEFDQQVIEFGTLVVADFFAVWCPPCRRLGSQLPKFAAEFPNVKFIKADVEQNESLAASFGVSSIPHVVFLKYDGKEIKTIGTVNGFDPNRITQIITANQ